MSKKSVNKVKHIDLKGIKDPRFLAGLKYKELNVLADDVRKEILNATSKNGGHLSSNLGVVELTIALHRSFDFSKDKIIFDVGHQSYTHKILTGRSLDNLRKKDGVSGFQKMNESPYDCYEAGHSSTSISAANGFAIARDLNHEKYDIVPVIGDASISSGLALEGLNSLGHSSHKVIIILNDNEMAISKPTGGLAKAFARLSTSTSYNRFKSGYNRFMHKTKFGSKIYDFTSAIKNWFKRKVIPSNIFMDMGFAYIGPVDGHNIKKLEKAIARAKVIKKSVVIHVSTFKGKGYKYAENDTTGYWHGVPPFDLETGKPLDMHEGKVSWSHVFSELTEKIIEEHKDAVMISPATQKGAGLDNLFEKYPERFIDVGIAEEHAITMAGALSLAGKHPIISIYSTFMQRAYDEISHDMARMNIDATFLVDRSGLVGADGETHQGIYDVAYLSSIPGTVVTMPSNIDEAKALYEESFNRHGAFFIRLPRSLTDKVEVKDLSLEYGKWLVVDKDPSKKLVIIGVGPLLRELQKELKDANIKCTLINALYLNPIDVDCLKSLLDYEQIVIYDPYSTRLGFVNQVMAQLLTLKFKGAVSAYFVENEFVKQATIKEQLEKYHLLPSQIVADLKK